MALPELTGLSPSLSLRDVDESDRAFLFDLYLETSGGKFAQSGLPAEQLRSLLEMQFQARESGWRGQYPDGRFQIIYVDSNRAGYLALGELEGEIALIYLGLWEGFRGLGIASELLRSLQNAAEVSSKKIFAHVERENPALGFWKHHGFRVLGDLGAYLKIEWRQP